MRWTSSYTVCFSYHEDSLELCHFLPIPITHTFQSFSSCSGCFVWNDCPLTFSDAQGKDVEELTAVARQEDGILFYMTSDADVAKIFSLNKKAPALVLWKKENEKLSIFGIMNLLQNHDIILQPNMRVNHFFSSPRLNIF